jgi:hypothetical protein
LSFQPLPADQIVLTAAHCVQDFDMEVVAGTVDLAVHIERVSYVIDWIRHANYSGQPAHHFDLGLLFVVPLRFNGE